LSNISLLTGRNDSLLAFVAAKREKGTGTAAGTVASGRIFPKDLWVIHGMVKILAFNGVPLAKVLHFCK
jgi:hypothetical protein